MLGAVAGLAALAGLVSFDAADAPNGRVAWVQIVLGVGLAAVVYGALVRVRGVRRAHLGGDHRGRRCCGDARLACPSSGTASSSRCCRRTVSRALCVLAFAGGAAAAATSYLTEEAR